MAKRNLKDRVRQVLKEKAEQPKAVTRRPRTAALPGMEDHAIKALDLLAANYADIRDSRMDLTNQEVDLKSRTMKLMKKYGKTKYQHNGILIEIEPGEETIKVRVKKVDEELPTDSDADAPTEPPAEDETLADA